MKTQIIKAKNYDSLKSWLGYFFKKCKESRKTPF